MVIAHLCTDAQESPYTCHPSLFCDTGGGGGVKSWRRQALFQGRHCFCPTPTLGGGGPVKEAGTHSPPCPQYLPNIKPHAMQIVLFEFFPPHNVSLA